MEDTDEFAWAVKVVIKRQMRDLMEQLRERGEEVAVMTVNVEDNTCSHFGSPNGEWFISEQKNITKSFLDFCQTNGSGKKKGKQAAGTQKKKSIASLKDSSKQSASNEVPEVRVTVPKNLVGDMTEEEVANLVGRIVATHLAVQEKGDGSSSGTQFDVLVRTANHSKKDTSVPSTPTRSARKRKPTAKYMEGMSTLKKSKRLDDDDAASELGTEDDTNVISLLSELNNTVLRKVQVSINNERNINLEDYDIEASENTEWLAVNIIHELDAISAGQLAHKKSIKLTLVVSDDDSQVVIQIRKPPSISKVKAVMYLNKASSNVNTVQKDTDVKTKVVVNKGIDDMNLSALDPDNLNVKFDTQNEDLDFGNDTFRTQNDLGYENDESGTQIEDVGYDDVESDNENESVLDDGDSDMEDNIVDGNLIKPENKSDSKSVIRKKRPNTGKKTVSDQSVECHICGVILGLKSRLSYHIREVHLKEKKHVCGICNKAFFASFKLSCHIRNVHMGEKRSICGVCKKGFFENYHLSRHIVNVHTRQCPNCDEFVNETVAWTKGVTIGTKRFVKCKCGCDVVITSKPTVTPKEVKLKSRYPCEICGKVFSRVSHMKRHMETHSGERESHKCHACDKSFTTKTILRKHYAQAHGISAFHCKTCSQSFLSAAELMAHKKAAHNQGQTSTVSVGNEQVNYKVINVLPYDVASSAATVSTVNNDMTGSILYVQEESMEEK